MANKFVGADRRTDLWFVDPTQVVLHEELRGRTFQPSFEAIAKLARSFSEEGQLQPVLGRRDQGGRLQVVAGFTRTAAARLLREGFEFDGVTYHDPEFTLKLAITSVNDDEAFRQNIVENAIRKQTSPIDDAHNQRRLRERKGYTDVDIAKLYGCHVSKVTKLKKLLELDDEEQRMVHEGDLTVTAALDLLSLPPDKRRAALMAVMDQQGKADGATIRALARDVALADDPDKMACRAEVGLMALFKRHSKAGEGEAVSTAKPAAKKARTVKEVKTFFENVDPNDKAVRDFCRTFIEWVAGGKSDAQLRKALVALKGVKEG